MILDSEDLCLSSMLQSSSPLPVQKLPLSPTLHLLFLEVFTPDPLAEVLGLGLCSILWVPHFSYCPDL